MNRSFASLAAIAIVLLAVEAAFAQARPKPLPNTLAARVKWVQFMVVGGHIEAVSPQLGRQMSTSSNAGDDRQEKLSVSVNAGLASVQYSLTSPNEQVNIDIADGRHATIRFRPQGDSGGVQVDFEQRPAGPVMLTVTKENRPETVTGPTLWHVMIERPDLAEHLLPLLEMMRPDWRLMDVADAVRINLLKAAAARRTVDAGQWSAWIKQLGSDRHSERQGAERQLRAAGQAVVPFLRGLDRSQLDAEQRFRIQSILAAYVDEGEDTPERIANRLAGDRHAWVAMLNNADEQNRRTALSQLEYLVGEKLEFDPAGDAASRAEQIAKIRWQVLAVAN
jgi:hypothetical protein